MRALVIGGAGFTGRHVVARLIERGCRVAVLDRGRRDTALPGGVEHIHASIASLEARDIPESDVVIQLYALTGPDAAATVAACRGRAGKLIVISSGDVYRAYSFLQGLETGPPLPMPLTEDAPLRTRLYPYPGGEFPDYEKILVERATLAAAGLEVCVLRLAALYGPGDRHRRLGAWLRRIESGAILMGAAEARWRWTHGYIENVAEGIVLAAVDGRSAGRVYNLGEEHTPAMRERLERLMAAAGCAAEIAIVPGLELPPGLRSAYNLAQDLVLDSGRIRRELGYREVVGEEEGLRRAAAWERANPRGAG